MRIPGALALLVAASLDAGCEQTMGAVVDAQDADSATADATELPPVEPNGPRCDDIAVPPSRRCLQAGWFLFSRWSTAEYYGPGASQYPIVPARPVYLDTFLVDEHEVTNDEYLEFVTRTGAIPPPELCGYDDNFVGPEPAERKPEVSGWVAGTPESGRGDHPVVCVTRAEARAFCEDRGGHLPTIFEWARSVRDAYPDARRFAWGDTPPPEAPMPWQDLVGYWYLPYVTMGRTGMGLGTLPVGSAANGASAAGVVDLTGNVGEILASCAEDLADIPDSTSPLVRPSGGGGEARCSDGVVVTGSTWRTVADPQFAFASTAYVMRDGARAIRYPDATHGLDEDTILEALWGDPRPIEPVVDTAGNDRRSWQIGWRCAYDATAP